MEPLSRKTANLEITGYRKPNEEEQRLIDGHAECEKLQKLQQKARLAEIDRIEYD